MHVKPTRAKDLMKKAEKDGWVLRSTEGSHFNYTKNGVTCPIPGPKNHLIPPGTVRSILKTLKEQEGK